MLTGTVMVWAVLPLHMARQGGCASWTYTSPLAFQVGNELCRAWAWPLHMPTSLQEALHCCLLGLCFMFVAVQGLHIPVKQRCSAVL